MSHFLGVINARPFLVYAVLAMSALLRLDEHRDKKTPSMFSFESLFLFLIATFFSRIIFDQITFDFTFTSFKLLTEILAY